MIVKGTVTSAKKREIAAGPLGVWLDRAIIAALFLFVIAAPVSIAATQLAWSVGLLFWLLRFAVWPRPELKRTPIDYAMFGFFILTGVSSFLSYEPMVSAGKLRAAMLFTIVYLFAENLRSVRLIRLLAILLVASTVITALFTFGQYLVGRGVKVYDVRADSPLIAARLESREKKPTPILSGDTLEEVDGVRISGPEQLVAALEGTPSSKPVKIKIYRVEWNPILELPRGRLLGGATPEERLGIQRWTRGRDWRATGFFGQWTTYGEALQLLGSLVFGLLVALPQKRSKWGALLLLALAAVGGALILTVMRASWLAFMFSVIVIAIAGLRWRSLLVIGACALPLVLVGLFVLQQKRNVGFFDAKDDSILWRQAVQREGFQLLVSSPRHLLVGIGMDSLKSHWRAWGMFDQGRRPWGHMHSDYLQIALERGVPALIAWLVLMALYGRTLWRLRKRIPAENWIEKGIVLGALGGLVGFLISGIVHYNWGDSEVVMIFYLIMGLSLALAINSRREDPVKA
ncbi:MAG TPA: O-antigen ligase family protein [Pyrinomonadaceae bacterium]|nr:O-antigen ligase family protein [Pyrinomonadaceae bacterium]